MVGKVILLIGCFFQLSLVAGSCIFESMSQCKAHNKDECSCPCLPKCCPEGFVLVSTNIGGLHGFDCHRHSTQGQLPEVPLVGQAGHNLKTSSSHPSFYKSGLPYCQGIREHNWHFDMHFIENVQLNVDYGTEYLLHIRYNDTIDKVASNVRNQDYRGFKKSHRNANVGYKPMMYFCFDLKLKDGGLGPNLESVALTCPKPAFTSNDVITKCCPPRFTFTNAFYSSCSLRQNSSLPWSLPINGHLQTEEELEQSGVLKYLPDKSLILPDVSANCKTKIYDVADGSFHIGPDAKIHSTDTHLDIPLGLDFFCVDQLYENEHVQDAIYAYQYDTTGPSYEYEYAYDADQFFGGGRVDVSLAEVHRQQHQCEGGVRKPEAMVALYCHEEIIQWHKCCKRGENLNLRARTCNADMAEPWQDPPIYTYDVISGQTKETHPRSTIVKDNMIKNMLKSHLHVSDEPFFPLIDGSLLYNGKIYNTSSYCLEHSFNYCEGKPSSSLRAIINDPHWHEVNKTSTLFGTNKEDSFVAKLIKRLGFPISIFFLGLTLVTYALLPKLREGPIGKMLMFIILSQIIVFTCLFIGTFSSDHVSRHSDTCLLQGLITYFFILCSFCWMSMMSFKMMNKLRYKIHKEEEGPWFAISSGLCFGVPLVLTLTVFALDRFIDRSQSWSHLRPGFGEESCWFTSCSQALSIFLYGPVSTLLACNVGMFIYTSRMICTYGGSSKLAHQYLSQGRKRSKSKLYHSQLNRQKKEIINILKLLVAMGLTWIIEVVAWFLSEDVAPPPEALVIVLNIMNIFQGPIVFMVFVMKPSTIEGLRETFGFGSKRTMSSKDSKNKRSDWQRTTATSHGSFHSGSTNKEPITSTFHSSSVMSATELNTFEGQTDPAATYLIANLADSASLDNL